MITLTGATGALGGAVAERLLAAGADLRLVVRDARRLPRAARAGVREVVEVPEGYADDDGLARAFSGTDVLLLVSAAESADRLDQHRTAVDAAAEAGVGRVVYTSFMGAAPDATFTLARDHWATEERLRERRLTTTAVRDGLYWDIAPHIAIDGVIRGPAGDGRVAGVARADVADVLVALLRDDRLAGETLTLTGPEALTFDEIAAALGARYERETVEEAYASRASYGAPGWQLDAWVSTYTAVAAGEMEQVSEDVPRVLGRPGRTLRQVLVTSSAE